MIGVRVRQEDRFHITRSMTECVEVRLERVLEPRKASVNRGQAPLLLYQVPVEELGPETVDARNDVARRCDLQILDLRSSGLLVISIPW